MTSCQSSTNSFHLIIQANSPGELLAWVAPLAKRFKQLEKNAFISLYLVPCQYATGRESAVAKSITELDEIVAVKESLLTLRPFKRFKTKASKGAVMYCGGDPLYTRLLSKKSSFPAYGYTEHDRPLGKGIKRTFYKHTDGDLMAVRIRDFDRSKQELLAALNLEPESYLLVQPASRPQYFKTLLPYFCDFIQQLHERRPDIPILLSLSDFTNDAEFKALERQLSAYNCRLFRGKSLELMALSSLLLSIPGTNTAEAMYMRLPMLTIFPTQFAELTPLDGILGLCRYLPVVGKYLHRFIIKQGLKRVQFISLPNIVAKQVVVPQLLKELPVDELCDAVSALYDDEAQLSQLQKALERYSLDVSIDTDICKVLLDNS